MHYNTQENKCIAKLEGYPFIDLPPSKKGLTHKTMN